MVSYYVKKVCLEEGMRILGIDPGFAIVGWGIIDSDRGSIRPVAYGAITTPAHNGLESRLLMIQQDLESLIEKYKPDEMAIEELFFNTNITTGIAVAEARGVILCTAHRLGLKISEYTPLQVKSAVCGFGRAQKPQVMEMTRRLLNLKEVPHPDDTADALAIAICHGQTGGTLLKRNLLKQRMEQQRGHDK